MNDSNIVEKNLNTKLLLFFIFLCLGLGILSALLSGDIKTIYLSLISPMFSPPPIVFPIVWTFLYIFLGIVGYIIYNLGSKKLLFYYFLSLIINFFWPIIFFKQKMFFFALVWLAFLIVVVYYLFINIKSKSKLGSVLLLIYLLWLFFALYLNAGFYALN